MPRRTLIRVPLTGPSSLPTFHVLKHGGQTTHFTWCGIDATNLPIVSRELVPITCARCRDAVGDARASWRGVDSSGVTHDILPTIVMGMGVMAAESRSLGCNPLGAWGDGVDARKTRSAIDCLACLAHDARIA